ncbi:MAG: hydrogenase formation protein HypD [Actinobacteria bacterium]|nr:MAG: hydrogenase formation protein HypD [Actinomycetota bacterium]
MKYISEYRDPVLAQNLVEAIHSISTRPVKFMEVCGTHTVAIAKHGLRRMMPENVSLLSGPGCPVCVTANRDIDRALAFAGLEDVIVTTFGDMMKVPGSRSSLTKEKAAGADIRVVYSALDAVDLAQKKPDKNVVFLGVGFETTAPTIAASIVEAKRRNLKNFFVHSVHKTVPEALRALAESGEVDLDGFILPGHVSAIIGSQPYKFLAIRYHLPSVVSGFEPLDVLQTVYMLLRQVDSGRAEVEIQYRRGVLPEGNVVAREMMGRVFETCDADWRAIGVIPGTGLGIRAEYADFDAVARFPVELPEPREPKGCECGKVLTGVKFPYECKLFGRACTPEAPIGPCMVSSEGSCAAYYRYQDYPEREK